MSDSRSDGSALSDGALLAASARGDRDAFAAIVDRHQARVMRFARTLTPDRQAAEDILQQTFLAAWRSAGQYRADATVSTWLLTIARNQAWRARVRRSREAIDETPVEELGLSAGWGQSDPERAAIREQERGWMMRAFARLDDEDRQILTLRDLEGLPGDDAAAVLGLGLAAMKSRLHRARLRLAIEVRKEMGHVAR